MDRIEALKSFLHKNPADLFSRHALAMEYIKRGDDETARQMLESALEIDPGYIGSYYHLGKLLERSGEENAAAEVYRKGMEMAQVAGDRHAFGELQTALSRTVSLIIMDLPTLKAGPVGHDLVARTAEFIRRERLLLPGQHLLLGVSGGVDSVVLCELMHRLGYPFSIAHVNYHLRGEESDLDEVFVRSLAARYGAEVHVHHAVTRAYAVAHRQSIQEAAREIRYDWFASLQRAASGRQPQAKSPSLHHGRLCLCTAHHFDDNVETVLMHFLKGTGVSGLRGMLPATDRAVRPLLFARRADIEGFAAQSGLSWVEDSSNLELKYSRNYLRHEVIPVIAKLFPQWSESMEGHIRRFRDIEQLVEAAVTEKLRAWSVRKGDEIHLPVNRIKQAAGRETILFYLLRDAGFSSAQVYEATRLLETESGRQVQSATHRLLRHHAWVVLAPRQSAQPHMTYVESLPATVDIGNGMLEISIEEGTPSESSLSDINTYYLEAKDIHLPLMARPWKKGDYFYPLGMRKKKKVARLFIDAKMSATEKERQWVLSSGDRILLVPGFRIDNRFRVTPATQRVLRVRFRPLPA
jgi:tRNA(Ile)-lysidine synthase